MATASPNPPVAQVEEEQVCREEQRRILRKEQLRQDLQELEFRHHEERQALSQELREFAIARKAIQDQVWADWINRPFPDQQRKLLAKLPTADRCLVEHGEEKAASKLKYQEQEGGASSSTTGAALNGKEGPGEGDEESSCCTKSSWIVTQQQDKEKQALLKELLPERNDLRLEVRYLLEDLEKKALRRVHEHRMNVEDPRVIRAHQRTEAARRAGLWRFVSKKKVEVKRRLLELKGSAEAEIAYVDGVKLGRPKFPECYEEIKNLLDIEQNPVFSKTRQEWNQRKEMLILVQERYRNRMASVKNEVYQVIGFFSVFQGVLLTAVSQSSLLYCHNKWSPITLSVLASAISTFGVIQKWNQINDLKTYIDYVTLDLTTAVRGGQRLREQGPRRLDFVQWNAEIEHIGNRMSKLLKNRHHAWLNLVLVTLTLVAFGVLFPISFWRILCKPGSPPSPRAP